MSGARATDGEMLLAARGRSQDLERSRGSLASRAADRPHASRPTNDVLLVSQGRSGSNWLLGIFDQSPETHCRNDANAVRTSLFRQLPDPIASREDHDDALAARWDEALQLSRQRMGERDPRNSVSKTYLHETGRALGLVSLVQRKASRRALSGVFPSLRGEEWRLPRWLGRRDALDASTFVVKLGLSAGWIPWVLRERPRTHVAHIVRHPGGYLASWSSRYLEPRDRDGITQANRDRLRAVVDADPRWGARFGALSSLPAEEAEMWYWAYCTETVRDAGATSSRYQLIRYEDLLVDLIGASRTVFERVGLAWSDQIERRIGATSMHPPRDAQAWCNRLDAEQRAMVQRILRSTSLVELWPGIA